MFVNVIVPLAVDGLYTYAIPEKWKNSIKVGLRVEVEIRRKLYAGLIYEISEETQSATPYKIKPISNVIDREPILTPTHLEFWKWIASYYMCSIGEVMIAALPSGLKLESHTKLVSERALIEEDLRLSDEEYLIAEAIEHRQTLTIEEVRNILNKKSIYPVINKLATLGILNFKEEIEEKYRPKKIKTIKLNRNSLIKSSIDKIFQLVNKSTHQKNILQYLLNLPHDKAIPVKEALAMTGANYTAVKKLQEKSLVIVNETQISRLKPVIEKYAGDFSTLSPQQQKCLEAILKYWEERSCVLLQGVTGSGKTRIFIELMKQCIETGRQCLYLLPEIALTSQIVNRLEAVFGEQIQCYHSRINNMEKVEIWQDVMKGRKIILGARSAIFLPFTNLGLIIIDEEHDPSFKQTDPAPRYHLRDTALKLAQKTGAKVILGSATPSLESLYNAQNGKFGHVILQERFGDSLLPEIKLIDLVYERKTGRLRRGYLGRTLLSAIERHLNAGRQVILFQNRRGFASAMTCQSCGWTAECRQCDVKLTYHKFSSDLRCHYCGYREKLPPVCPVCKSSDIKEIGAGTERIEDEIQKFFPLKRIERIDWDSVKGASRLNEIISDFQSGSIDILVGTQMLAKGFDFDNVGMVGIVNADASLMMPDFRAAERSFHLFQQVAGRAGRRTFRGEVFIQTYQVDHPVLRFLKDGQDEKFYAEEMKERELFTYPPFYRMINISLLDRNKDRVDMAAAQLVKLLNSKLGSRVLGPVEPAVGKIKNFHIMEITIKFENESKVITYVKKLIDWCRQKIQQDEHIKRVRMKINVDP